MLVVRKTPDNARKGRQYYNRRRSMAITRDDASGNLSDAHQDECLSTSESRLRMSRRSELALLLSMHSPRVVYVWREIEGSSEFIDMMSQLTVIPIWKITLDDCFTN